MDDLSRRLSKLGVDVSNTVERLTDQSELEASRKMWLTGLSRAPERSRRPLALALAASLAVIALVFTLVRPRDQITFVVGPATRGAVGEWVAAGGGAALDLRFSEGTTLSLAPGARARVTETTARGATILLERGEVTASVVHAAADTRWDLQAGPFEVRVIGTRFDASWDPAGEAFSLTMAEGVVLVKGPLLHAGRELRAGERLRVSVREGAMELRTASAPSPPPPAAILPPAPQAAPNPGPIASAPVASVPVPSVPVPSMPVASVPVASVPVPNAPVASAPAEPAPRPAEPTWRELAAAGKYADALAAAERAGFSREVETAGSQDLAMLADAARYGARPALARQALLAQRRRFGVRGSSAFVLGKIAADQQGSSGEARSWFETYLAEEPNGALAEQALGRILEMSKHNPASAQKAAERYLARYPNGAHAPLARSLSAPASPNVP